MSRALADAAADLLLEHGPLTLPELHALAVDRGHTRARDPRSLRSSLRDGPLLERPDGRWDAAARLLRGQVFTTRPRRPEHDDVLWTYRDLDGLTALRRLPLAGGGELRRGAGSVECWSGPSGWLPELQPGQLVGLRWDGVALSAEVVDEVASGDDETAADLREVLARHAHGQDRPSFYGGLDDRFLEPRSLRGAVLSALVEDPWLFALPRPPLRELLPLPHDLRPHDHLVGRRERGQRVPVTVPLPRRVHDELGRCADRLGEQLPDHLARLLGAAADRVQPADGCCCEYWSEPSPGTAALEWQQKDG